MPLLLTEHFRTARKSLRRTRMRTLLTVTGIAIGIASITAILALGSGITRILNDQAVTLGDAVAVIRPDTKTVSTIEHANPLSTAAYMTSPLSERDVNDISKIKGVEAVAPLMTISGSVRSSDERVDQSTVLATTPLFTEITDLTLRDGQFIDDITVEDTAVIGNNLAIDLFGTNDAVGKHFKIRGQQFTVIGVLKYQNNPINYNNINFDHTAIISLDSGKLFNQGIAQIQQINVKTSESTPVSTIARDISERLKENHDGEEDSLVYTGKNIAQPVSGVFALISVVMAIIAGISLLVGGIGIMNIMLVGVAERTREIGLRKAVGASNGSIVLQFMIESVILSFLGGVIGYVIGYLLPSSSASSSPTTQSSAGRSSVLHSVFPSVLAPSSASTPQSAPHVSTRSNLSGVFTKIYPSSFFSFSTRSTGVGFTPLRIAR